MKNLLLPIFLFILLMTSCSDDDNATRSRLAERITTSVQETSQSKDVTILSNSFTYGKNGYFDQMDFEITVEKTTTDSSGQSVTSSFSTNQEFTVDSYNTLNQLVSDRHKYTDYNGKEVEDYGVHTYNDQGQLIKTVVTYNNGVVTTIHYEYNSEGQKSKEVSTEKNDEYYVYNKEGGLVKHTMDGVVTEYELDGRTNPSYFIAPESYAKIWPKENMRKQNVVKETITANNGDQLVIDHLLTYDKAGRITKNESQYTEGSTKFSKTIEYIYE